MSFIVNFAKSLGIQPNQNMSISEAKNVLKAIKDALKNQMPAEKQHKIDNDSTLKEMLYTFQKQVKRTTNPSIYQSAVALFQNPPQGIICRTQTGTDAENGFNPSGDFVWQTTPAHTPIVERFTCDIDICSPHFPSVLENLRTFILKHQGGFKIPYFGHEERSDTLNCYMRKPITPEIATAFYQIVQPCLNTRFHDKLDGVPIYANNKIIKGIKIGPEYALTKDKGKNQAISDKEARLSTQSIQGLAKTYQGQYIFLMGSSNRPDCSLGQKSAEIEVHQLCYYLAGLEGKSPLTLMNDKLTAPYEKHIDIGNFLNKYNDKHTPVAYQEKSKQTNQAMPIKSTDTPSSQAINLWGFKAAPYFDVKNGILYLKEDLSLFDKAGIKQLKLKETLGISARPLKNTAGEIYAYAPTTLNQSDQWQQLLQAIQSYQHQAEPIQMTQEEAHRIARIASQDFKAEGYRLMFRDIKKKQTHTGLNAYDEYNSLISLLREKHHIRYEPINENGTCIGFKLIGNTSRKAMQHLLEALKNPEKYDVLRYNNNTTSSSFGR